MPCWEHSPAHTAAASPTSQPQASAADLAHACAGAPDAPARPFLALRAAACTPVISARGGGGSESHQSHKWLACTDSAAPNHELEAPLQPRAGRWEEDAR